MVVKTDDIEKLAFGSCADIASGITDASDGMSDIPEKKEIVAQPRVSKKNLITLTDAAVEQIGSLLRMRERESFGIRIKIKSGGCSGWTYAMEYVDSPQEFDEVIESSGVKVVVDPKAVMYLIGTTMDYISDTFKSGFTFTNPNEKSRCGCGKSFSV